MDVLASFRRFIIFVRSASTSIDGPGGKVEEEEEPPEEVLELLELSLELEALLEEAVPPQELKISREAAAISRSCFFMFTKYSLRLKIIMEISRKSRKEENSLLSINNP